MATNAHTTMMCTRPAGPETTATITRCDGLLAAGAGTTLKVLELESNLGCKSKGLSNLLHRHNEESLSASWCCTGIVQVPHWHWNGTVLHWYCAAAALGK